MTPRPIRTEALVTALEGDYAVLNVIRPAGGCGRCHEPGGCATGLAGPPPGCGSRYRLVNALGVQPGETVLLCISEGSVFKAAMLSYGVTTLLIIVFAAIAAARFGDDAVAACGAVLGLVLGLLVTRRAGGYLAPPTMVPAGEVFSFPNAHEET